MKENGKTAVFPERERRPVLPEKAGPIFRGFRVARGSQAAVTFVLCLGVKLCSVTVPHSSPYDYRKNHPKFHPKLVQNERIFPKIGSKWPNFTKLGQ